MSLIACKKHNERQWQFHTSPQLQNLCMSPLAIAECMTYIMHFTVDGKPHLTGFSYLLRRSSDAEKKPTHYHC